MANEHYVFVPEWSPEMSTVDIQDEEHHHLSRVLRVRAGQQICILNGKGAGAKAELMEITQIRTRCQVIQLLEPLNSPAIQVHLAVGIIRRPRWEWLLEKAVELGVRKIIPLKSRYTVREHYRPDRDKKIMISALKQCGRYTLPELEREMDFTMAVHQRRGKGIILHQEYDIPYLREVSGVKDEITLFVGPEGGFSDEEILYAEQEGVYKAHMGTVRLRTETAAINAVAYYTYWNQEVSR
ncbi:MAG: rRNA (uracil1498-N3)-methyltransferase [Candidatus Marinimicrobia bacterium]|jgi:16S rRNA (uracil1498-N3)-methyltransferase|nr:rRNA (uracil1498-N3)-methyltransferase [Candidatus Neomarinimicrobiota bacterium]